MAYFFESAESKFSVAVVRDCKSCLQQISINSSELKTQIGVHLFIYIRLDIYKLAISIVNYEVCNSGKSC